MPMTSVMSEMYDNLKAMDDLIRTAEAHLRVVKDAKMPSAVDLAAKLENAKQQRRELMTAIENEAART